MSPDLVKLVESTRKVRMSDQDREEQRRSFAFGSAKIENDDITRKLVDEAAERIEGERRGTGSVKRS